MTYETLLYEKADGIATVTINRPDSLNALNNQVYTDLYEIFGEIEKDEEVRVIILTGAGEKAFSAGFDLSDSANSHKTSPKGRELWTKLDRFSKPVIAAINGHVLAGGMELALSCHFRVMVDDPKVNLGLTELNVGIIPGWGGYQERQTRRKADQLLRQTLAEKLAGRRQELDVAQKDLISHGRIDLVDDVGSAVTQLQTFIDRVRVASYGYSGLFDAAKVNEAELEQLYNFDVALFQYVERLDAATSHLRDAIPTGEGLAQTVRVIQDICREANSTFDQREHVILGSV